VLDRLAASAPRRDKPADPSTVARIEMLFEPVLTELWDLTAEEAP
jgi:hypothetical protein